MRSNRDEGKGKRTSEDEGEKSEAERASRSARKDATPNAQEKDSRPQKVKAKETEDVQKAKNTEKQNPVIMSEMMDLLTVLSARVMVMWNTRPHLRGRDLDSESPTRKSEEGDETCEGGNLEQPQNKDYDSVDID